MVELNVTIDADKAKKDFSKLARRVKDLRPVFTDFIKYYQDKIMPASFNTKGSLMGKKWQSATDQYRKWKSKSPKNTSGSSTANLKLTGRLYDAATGGSGWYQKIGKKTLEFGIKRGVIKYANRHQEGTSGMPQRPFFYTANGDIPKRAWLFLKTETEQYLTKGIS